MKKIVIVGLIVLVLGIFGSLYAAYTTVVITPHNTYQGKSGDWLVQKTQFDTPLVWYTDSTVVKDSCRDTVYTSWMSIGSIPGKTLDKLIYYFRMTSIDTFGYQDSATWFNLAYQTKEPTDTGTLMTTRILRTHATDTLSTITIQSDSIYLGTVYAGYIRARIIYYVVADSGRMDWSSGYSSTLTQDVRAKHKSIKIEEYVKPIWR